MGGAADELVNLDFGQVDSCECRRPRERGEDVGRRRGRERRELLHEGARGRQDGLGALQIVWQAEEAAVEGEKAQA